MKNKKSRADLPENEIIEKLYDALPALAKLVGGDAAITAADGTVIKSFNHSGQSNYNIIGTQSVQAAEAMQAQKYAVSWSNRVPGSMAIRIPLSENYLLGLNNESISEKFGKLILQPQPRDEEDYSYTALIGQSEQMKSVKKQLRHASRQDSPVLISAEAGLEQEKYAGVIHYMSARKAAPFISVKCASLPASAFEQIFFGIDAFTADAAAPQYKPGAFEQADGGTLYLDGVDLLDMLTQRKLLNVLESGFYINRASKLPTKINVRLIASCADNPKRQIKKGTLLSELYWHLAVNEINIPPLRFRREDIYPQLKHFVSMQNQRFGAFASRISDEALDILSDYRWGGNVAELRGCVEQIFSKLGNDVVIKPKHLPAYILVESKKHSSADVNAPGLKELLDECEKRIIEESLVRNNWSRINTAAELGIDTATLWRKMVKLNIKAM